MATLLIRDLPGRLHERLKERAEKNRRSVAKEVIVILEEALGVSALDKEAVPEAFVGHFALSDDWLATVKKEGRP
jgi:plasmid stability protein